MANLLCSGSIPSFEFPTLGGKLAMPRRHKLLLILSASIILVARYSSLAQDSVWVRNVSARASMQERTLAQARTYALQLAREEAVKTAFGTTTLSNCIGSEPSRRQPTEGSSYGRRLDDHIFIGAAP